MAKAKRTVNGPCLEAWDDTKETNEVQRTDDKPPLLGNARLHQGNGSNKAQRKEGPEGFGATERATWNVVKLAGAPAFAGAMAGRPAGKRRSRCGAGRPASWDRRRGGRLARSGLCVVAEGKRLRLT